MKMPDIPGKILVHVDKSDPATAALALAGRLSNSLGAELHVLHVVHVTPYTFPQFMNDAQIERIAEQAEDYLTEILGASPDIVPTARHVRVGRIEDEVMRLAEQMRVGMIVIGNRTEGAIDRIVLGDTAESVVRHAHCPVLSSVPRPKPEPTRRLCAEQFTGAKGKPRRKLATRLRSQAGVERQSSALKLNSPPSLMPENQRAVTVLVLV